MRVCGSPPRFEKVSISVKDPALAAAWVENCRA
jgi:hypothetical protein